MSNITSILNFIFDEEKNIKLDTEKINNCIPDRLIKYIPKDHANAMSADYYLEKYATKRKKIELLDLGCGNGQSEEFIKKISKDINWVGLEIDQSPEYKKVSDKRKEIYTYNGRKIPFKDNKFDIIFCKQVLEHVEKPEIFIREVDRVLSVGGIFIGSFSQLEPYHSFSLQNFTAYGFYKLLKSTSLNIVELRPGIDCFSLITRRLFGRNNEFNKLFKKSKFYTYIDKKRFGNTIQEINCIKILFSGHIIFAAKKG
jgi:SAM-dependent methyltransferase